jgi:hypothetical protein
MLELELLCLLDDDFGDELTETLEELECEETGLLELLLLLLELDLTDELGFDDEDLMLLL